VAAPPRVTAHALGDRHEVRGIDARLRRARVAEAAHHAHLPVGRADRTAPDGEDRLDRERHVGARHRYPWRAGHLLARGEQLGVLPASRLPAADTAGRGGGDRRPEPHAVVRAHRGEERDPAIHQRTGVPLQPAARARVVAGLGEREHVQLRHERMTDPRRQAPADPLAPRVKPDDEHARPHRRLAHRSTPGSPEPAPPDAER
jgi:hypothetical protein